MLLRTLKYSKMDWNTLPRTPPRQHSFPQSRTVPTPVFSHNVLQVNYSLLDAWVYDCVFLCTNLICLSPNSELPYCFFMGDWFGSNLTYCTWRIFGLLRKSFSQLIQAWKIVWWTFFATFSGKRSVCGLYQKFCKPTRAFHWYKETFHIKLHMQACGLAKLDSSRYENRVSC